MRVELAAVTSWYKYSHLSAFFPSLCVLSFSEQCQSLVLQSLSVMVAVHEEMNSSLRKIMTSDACSHL